MTTDFAAVLRTMDAAQPLTADQHRTATVTLDWILESDPAVTGPAPVPRRPRRRMPLIAAAAAVAAAGGAFAVLPGDGGGRAYASWTPAPTPLTAAEIALIGPECRDDLGSSLFRDTTVALAERRGDYVMMLLRSTNPDMAGSCLVHNVPGSDEVDDVRAAAASSSSAARTVTGGRFTQGAIADFIDASVTEGAVGDEVAGVTVRAGKFTAQATVKDGQYVVWWPGPAFTSDRKGGSEPRVILEYDIILRNGTIIADARPTRPS